MVSKAKKSNIKSVPITDKDLFNLQLLYTHLISELNSEQLKKVKEGKELPSYIQTIVKIINVCDPSFDLKLFED